MYKLICHKLSRGLHFSPTVVTKVWSFAYFLYMFENLTYLSDFQRRFFGRIICRGSMRLHILKYFPMLKKGIKINDFFLQINFSLILHLNLNLNVNLQGSYGAIRKWVGRPDYGHGAASRALKTSREPASAKEAGRSFHSLTVLKTNWCQIDESDLCPLSTLYLLCFPGRGFDSRSTELGSTASRLLRIL